MNIDWQKVCLNLRRYKPLAQIAKDVGCSEQHINRLARGDTSEPKFYTGIALLDLHYEQCKDKHKQEVICYEPSGFTSGNTSAEGKKAADYSCNSQCARA